ncbi:MAG: tetraacyldisaccharide 4'-kinase, partial [Pseudomonadales bacterium]|nr:tetraacyldisaccharide 4'-kinase [Pseudomonadales bacterium]
MLLPLAGLFAVLVRRRYSTQRQRLDFSPARGINAVVVVVGNISVGGTGKTPLLLKLASDLVERGYRVAVLS